MIGEDGIEHLNPKNLINLVHSYFFIPSQREITLNSMVLH